jgi:hypothetical protein
MKKEILLEINRVHEIMGIKTNKLLVEGPILKKLTTYLDDLFQDADVIKPLVNDPDFFSVKGVRVSDGELRNIRSLISDPDLINVADPKTIKTLGRIISKDTEKVSELYYDVFDDIFKTTKTTEKEFYKKINEKIKAGSSIDDELERLFPDDILSQSVFRPTFEGKLNLAKRGELNPKQPKVIDPTTKQPWESPGYVNEYIGPELSKISKLYADGKEVALGNAVGRFFRQSEPFWSMYFRKWWTGVFQKQETNILKAKQLISDAITKTQSNQDATRELQQALIQIILVRKNLEFDLTTILSKFLKDNPNIPKGNLDAFLNSTVAGDKKVSDLLDALNVSGKEAATKASKIGRQAYLELLPLGALKTSETKINNLVNIFKQPAKRWLVNMPTFKNPASVYESILKSALRGRNRTLWVKLREKSLIYFIAVPFVISFWENYVKGNLISSNEINLLRLLLMPCNQLLNTDEYKNNEEVKKFCDSIKKYIDKIDSVQNEDYFTTYFNNLPRGPIQALTGEESTDLWSIPKAFTWWDDWISGLYNTWQSSPWPLTGKPGEIKALEEAKLFREKYRKELIELGIDPDVSIEKMAEQLEKLGKKAEEKVDKSKDAINKTTDSLKTNVPPVLDDNMKKLEIQRNFLGVDSLSKYGPILDKNFGFNGVKYKDNNQYILKFKDSNDEFPIFRDPNDSQNKGWYFKDGNKKLYLKN